MAVAFLLVALPLGLAIDAWRFPGRAWRVAGHRRWVWRTVPALLVGVAVLPFGAWWFRSFVLAADATCVAYLAKVRPTLRLDSFLDREPPPGLLAHPSPSTISIEARPAQPRKWSRLLSVVAPYDTLLLGSVGTQPHVVAVNGQGGTHVLFAKPTWEAAIEARDRVRDDLLRMGLDEWRRFYGVPADFVDP
ncbi:MAG: hypothetical protein M3326_04085 [Actinomycetota bacterium]|nr:hypothetical protein [Actinomycetota bacterium]